MASRPNRRPNQDPGRGRTSVTPVHITISDDGTLGLDKPTEFTAFDVQATDPDAAAVLEALGPHGEAASQDDHVFVKIDAVRTLAGDAATAAWESGFAKMLEFADSNGWLNDAGDAVKAHIEQG